MAGGVTIHTIFWNGGTQTFPASPAFGVASYENTIKNFFTDVSAGSTGMLGQTCTTAACSVFTVLTQYAEGTKPGDITSGSYSISYNKATDSIDDSDPYPAVDLQCASPNNTPFACITDGQIQTEIDKIAPTNERGLNNIWFVFLPPGVDECILPGECGTNAFAAYHSDFDINGHGVTVYAVAIDPTIEVGPISPGKDPNGNRDAEATTDAAGHETVEAITDPQGVGWMDPNGFEVADKCEFGSQYGQPLGTHGPDTSEFNQVIDGHPWLEQDMWSNDDGRCVQSTTQTSNPLPLPQVNLTQFSNAVSGNVGQNKAFGVTVALVREAFNPNALPGTDQVVVAHASTVSNPANGSWSVTLPGHAVGDDRDQINVIYSGAGAPTNRGHPDRQRWQSVHRVRLDGLDRDGLGHGDNQRGRPESVWGHRPVRDDGPVLPDRSAGRLHQRHPDHRSVGRDDADRFLQHRDRRGDDADQDDQAVRRRHHELE